MCQRKISTDIGEWAFGSGPNYAINTNENFHVMYEFWTNGEQVDGKWNLGDLTEIRQTISQGSDEFVISSDCQGVADLTDMLGKLSLGIANYSVGKSNVYKEGTCTEECESSNAKISNLVWKDNVAIVQPEPDVPEPKPEPKPEPCPDDKDKDEDKKEPEPKPEPQPEP